MDDGELRGMRAGPARPSTPSRATPPTRASVSVVVLGLLHLALAGCGDPCPEELLPGICAQSRHSVPIGWGPQDAILVDLDGDGSSELLSLTSGRLHIAWRDGRRRSRSLPGFAYSLAAGDFNGDGRPDLAFYLQDEVEAKLSLFSVEQTPSGAVDLREFDSVSASLSLVRSLWAGDLDGDGRDEILLMDRQAEAIITIDGQSREARETPLGAVPVAFDLDDLDGDGVLDLAVADFLGAQILVLGGDGAGGFAPAVAYPSALGLDSIAFGDLNDDGALDLIGRGAAAEAWLHPGDGAGGLGEPSLIELSIAGGEPRGIALVPPGSDGVGGVMIPEDGALATYLIDPGGAAVGRARAWFSASLGDVPLQILRAAPGAWLLLGQGIQEIEIAEASRPVEVWRHSTDNPDVDRWASYTVGDVDLDGVPDIAALHETREFVEDDWVRHAEIFLGDGDGHFSQGASLAAEPCQTLVIGDFDGDGAGDVLGGPVAPWVSFGESSAEDVIALSVGDDDIWVEVSALETPTRTRLILEIRRFDGDAPTDRLEIATIDPSGEITDKLVLVEVTELLGHWLRDLDDDGDDDLVAIARDANGERSILSWIAEDETLLPGPVHRIAEITGWTDDIMLAGIGVGTLDPADDDAPPELLLAGEDGLARIRGIDGLAPTVELETGEFEPELPPRRSVVGGERIPSLVIGDLDGDDAADVVRCAPLCSVLLAGDAGLAGDATPLHTPPAIASLDLDDDGRLDLIVGDELGPGAMLTATHAGPQLVHDWSHIGLGSALFGDLDADGTPEIVFATQIGTVTFWQTGGEDEQTIARMADWAPGRRLATIADLDRDGADEIIIAPVDLPGRDNAIATVRWDGSGLRLDALDAPGLRPRYDILALDVDGDGIDDLVATEHNAVMIAYGIDPGRFEQVQRIPAPIRAPARSTVYDRVELTTADLNRDGRPDLLSFDDGQLTVLWGRSDREWGTSTIDVDDFVIRGQDLLIRRADTLYLLTPSGEVLGPPRRVIDDPLLVQAERMISGGDLDGDGLEDLVTLQGQDVWIWITRGAGLREPYVMPWILSPGVVLSIADIDGGGLAELVFGSSFGLSLYWGEGGH